jgi:mannose-6-phosphate isomerase-like protein (cupin superfamily)
MAVDAKPKGKVVTLRTPLLSAGRTTDFLARGDLLAVAVKVYAEGGENGLHAHTTNEHIHMVLQGQATFYDEDGKATVVNQYEGMWLPKGAYYYFQSSGTENLVLMSCYASDPAMKGGEGRMAIDGTPMEAHTDPRNKREEGTPIPGKFFGG